eukprot:TRINITY_DN357_c0_g1_i1.p1 TRINITY_DN357_c0_g1~~TRINITY_DN357_c0_g1_i1.p1  ORF type:complete len:362 (+),score=56.59 TRINITY_DN357_c0_g1_i1:532-1617(+)
MATKLIVAILLLIACSANGIHLYFGTAFFADQATLRVFDTTTNRIYNVGPIVDAQGTRFSTNAMHYHNGTGLIYAIPGGRTRDEVKSRSLISIDPNTAQVVRVSLCDYNITSNYTWQSMTFDYDKRIFLLGRQEETRLYYISEADMIAGNCSAVKSDIINATYSPGFYGSGMEYLGNGKIVYLNWNGYTPNNGFDVFSPYNESVPFLRLPVTESSPYRVPTSVDDKMSGGDFATAPDGTIWGIVRSWGPQPSFMYQLRLPTNESDPSTYSVIPISEAMPRSSHGLTVGPTPTRALTPYSTGVSGHVLLATTTNELWKVDLQNMGAVKVANASKQVLAVESFGSWNSVYVMTLCAWTSRLQS